MLKVNDIIETKTDTTFSYLVWMKHENGLWYVSKNGNLKRIHCLYSEEYQTARENLFNGQYGPEIFLVGK